MFKNKTKEKWIIIENKLVCWTDGGLSAFPLSCSTILPQDRKGRSLNSLDTMQLGSFFAKGPIHFIFWVDFLNTIIFPPQKPFENF